MEDNTTVSDMLYECVRIGHYDDVQVHVCNNASVCTSVTQHERMHVHALLPGGNNSAFYTQVGMMEESSMVLHCKCASW